MEKKKSLHRPEFTLQNLCLTRFMTNLCNNPQLLHLIKIFNLPKNVTLRLRTRNGSEFAAIHSMASHLITQICKSPMLKKKSLKLLWPVSYRIMLWKSKYVYHIENEFLDRFYWTDRGRIDSIRTAKNILSNKNISVRKRFVLASSVCLQKELEEIWSEMSNEDKAQFSVENLDVSPLTLLWVETVKGTDGEPDVHMVGAFVWAIKTGLLYAVKYFFSVSSVQLRNLCALHFGTIRLLSKLNEDFFLEEDEYDILFFLYFELDNVYYQMKLLNTLEPIELSLLLYSSNHDFFLNLFEERLHSMDDRAVSLLLYLIMYYFHLEVNTDNDYLKLFVDVWKRIPTPIKNYVKESNQTVVFFCILIKDNFPFLLKRGAFKTIRELTSTASESCNSMTPFGFHHKKWEFLHFLIEEEIVTVTGLKLFRNDAFNILKIRKPNRFAWITILKFVQKVRMKA